MASEIPYGNLKIAKIWVTDVFVFVCHQAASTLAVIYTAGVGTLLIFAVLKLLRFPLDLPRAAGWLLTELHFFPIQIGVGLWCGWWISRELHQRSMLRVWILPGLVLCFAVWHGPILAGDTASVFDRSASSFYPLRHYFGAGCSVRERCLDQMMFTLPFYTSAAYALGALLQRTLRRNAEQA
jgi:hypothetical protein